MEYVFGIIVSITVETFKALLPEVPEKYRKLVSYVILFVVSLAGALLWFTVEKSSYSEDFIKVFVAAAAFHNLVLRRLEGVIIENNPPPADDVNKILN